MRVQRAPRAAQQPQPAPKGIVAERDGDLAGGASAGRATGAITGTSPHGTGAALDIDVTQLHARTDAQTVRDEVVRHLLFACKHELIIDAESDVVVARLSAGGLIDEYGDPIMDRPDALLVVGTLRTGLIAVGDWGVSAGAIAVIGPVSSLLSSPQSALTVERRQTVRVSLSAASAPAFRIVRALDVLAETIEGSR